MGKFFTLTTAAMALLGQVAIAQTTQTQAGVSFDKKYVVWNGQNFLRCQPVADLHPQNTQLKAGEWIGPREQAWLIQMSPAAPHNKDHRGMCLAFGDELKFRGESPVANRVCGNQVTSYSELGRQNSDQQVVERQVPDKSPVRRPVERQAAGDCQGSCELELLLRARAAKGEWSPSTPAYLNAEQAADRRTFAALKLIPRLGAGWQFGGEDISVTASATGGGSAGGGGRPSDDGGKPPAQTDDGGGRPSNDAGQPR